MLIKEDLFQNDNSHINILKEKENGHFNRNSKIFQKKRKSIS